MSWLHCHNEAYRRLAGVAAVNRIDNVKTAIARGAGAWGEIHPVYRAYARAVGFHIDACAPREPRAKRKVEAKVRLSRRLIDPAGRAFEALEALQAWSDRRIEAWARRAICPATGKTVEESWERELAPSSIDRMQALETRGASSFDCKRGAARRRARSSNRARGCSRPEPSRPT